MLTPFACLMMLHAQTTAVKPPKWEKKAEKAVLTITTYDGDGRQLGSVGGFFVSEKGEAVSAYSPFIGAEGAVASDFDGNSWDVAAIISADEMYDVIRFKVNAAKKTVFLQPVASEVPVDEQVYLLTGKENEFLYGTITGSDKLKDPYQYYKLSFPVSDKQTNLPLVTSDGKVFAVSQDDASGRLNASFGVSVGYIMSLSYSSLDALNATYTKIKMRKAWPSDVQDAEVLLFLLASSEDNKTYFATVENFVAAFPDNSEGYMRRATLEAKGRAQLFATPDEQRQALVKAKDDIKSAIKYAADKSDIYYRYSQLIMDVATADSTLNDNDWSLNAALSAVREAIQLSDKPTYSLLEGNILFNMGEYDKAYAAYMKINAGTGATASSYYLAAMALQNVHGASIGDMIALIDSAVVKVGITDNQTAAAYILERAELKMKLAMYKEAAADYDLIYSKLTAQVNDNFFFSREQARSLAGDIDGALADIRTAIRMNADVADYYAEEAGLLVRKTDYDGALASVEKALAIAPDFAACFRIRGVCYQRLSKTAEACQAFTRAQELGDQIAPRLLQTYCK
jgi:Flp pilus assembly protein TadD